MADSKTVYLIPGLGATEKAFHKLHFKGYERVGIKWLKPKEDEDIPRYAKRLSKQIKDPENAIICGLSFGGIVAVELAKILPVQKTIIISSVKTRKEYPNTILMAKLLPVHKLFKAETIGKFKFWYGWAFGKTTKEDKALIKEMIDIMDGPFTDWCARQAVNWKNKTIPENLYHIHGTSDRIFPSYKVKNYYKVKKGTHFMIVNRAETINEYIEEILHPIKPIKKTKNKKKNNEKIS